MAEINNSGAEPPHCGPSGCAHEAPGAAPRDPAEVGLDREETVLLEALRHLFSTFARPERQGWSRALYSCLDGFHEAEAPHVWVALLGLVQTLRQSRNSGFTFANPDCPNCARTMTAEERQLMGVIAASRRGRRGVAQTHALLLCEGGEIGPVLGAAGHLGRAVARSLASQSAPAWGAMR